MRTVSHYIDVADKPVSAEAHARVAEHNRRARMQWEPDAPVLVLAANSQNREPAKVVEGWDGDYGMVYRVRFEDGREVKVTGQRLSSPRRKR